MVSQAEEIRNLLFTEWSLGGTLSKVPLDTQAGDSSNMKEIVYFWDRKQVEGNEQTKSITVEKMNDESQENNTYHPTFTEEVDVYYITMFYRVTDVQQTVFSDALDDVEKMATETVRILKTIYDPSTSIGPYFLSQYRWVQHDHTDSNQPELRRTLILSLSRIVGFSDSVFQGFKGVLSFQLPVTADNPPGANYEYVGMNSVATDEGYEEIPYLTKDIATNGRGNPYLQRGSFRGTFQAQIYAVANDLDGTTTEKLYQIFLTQNNSPIIGQVPLVTLLHSNVNTEDPVKTLNLTSVCKISSMRKDSDQSGLVTFKMTGRLIKPTTAQVV